MRWFNKNENANNIPMEILIMYTPHYTGEIFRDRSLPKELFPNYIVEARNLTYKQLVQEENWLSDACLCRSYGHAFTEGLKR